MLRFYCTLFVKSSFPLVPLKHFVDVCKKQARLDLRDAHNWGRLLTHLTDCAHQNIMTLLKEKRRFLLSRPGAQYVSLKEVLASSP